jgi:hypothetical protein
MTFNVAGFEFPSEDDARIVRDILEDVAEKLTVPWGYEDLPVSFCSALDSVLMSGEYNRAYVDRAAKFFCDIYRGSRKEVIDQGRQTLCWMACYYENALEDEVHERRLLALAFCCTLITDALDEEYEV